jgi:EAL domain-containing protein (putative c-di-GMP-specific phosphodiesterase class I)
VIKKALSQLLEWRNAGIDLNISVNIAARQLLQQGFVRRLRTLIEDYEENVANHLVIEIVETTALEDVTLVSNTIRQCREFNIRFAIDDFGTGFSSLTHLKHLQVDELKIDKSFVQSMLRNPEDLAIVSGVIGLSGSFKHEVIAEGVETIDQILILMDLGCHIMQGYGIARPMPASQVFSWFREFEPDPLWKLPFAPASSRYYFELLLAEINHDYWTNTTLANFKNNQENCNSDRSLEPRQCRFGHWLYGDGIRQFGDKRWFLQIKSIHSAIHESALRLSEFQRNGYMDKITDEARFLRQHQALFRDILKDTRETLFQR